MLMRVTMTRSLVAIGLAKDLVAQGLAQETWVHDMRTHVEPQAGGDGVAQRTEVTVIDCVIDGAEAEQGIRDRIDKLGWVEDSLISVCMV